MVNFKSTSSMMFKGKQLRESLSDKKILFRPKCSSTSGD